MVRGHLRRLRCARLGALARRTVLPVPPDALDTRAKPADEGCVACVCFPGLRLARPHVHGDAAGHAPQIFCRGGRAAKARGLSLCRR
eukprot:2757481-Prymnesium_polylepis.1